MPMGRSKWRLIGEAGAGKVPQPITLNGLEPVWYPGIPLGTFEKYGQTFTVTEQYLQEMVQKLHDGFPGPLGVPIDESNTHQGTEQLGLLPNEDGADAWIVDAEFRADEGWLYFQVKPTAGIAEVVEKRPYISPKFAIGEGVDPKYGMRNFLRSGAFVSQPWFWPQPGLIAASMNTIADEDEPDEAGTVSGAAQTESGGTAMTPEEIKQLQTDLAAAQATIADMETAKTEADAAHEAELTARDEQIAALTARAEKAEGAQQELTSRIEAVEKALATKEQDAAIADKMAEIQADKRTEFSKLDNGEVIAEERVPSPEYALRAASAFVKGDKESQEELHVFLAANGNRVPTVGVMNSKPALLAASASRETAEPLDEWGKLAQWPGTEQKRSRIRQIMEGQPTPNFNAALYAATPSV